MTALAILVAAGRGERMGASRPKAFLELGGEALLLKAARAFEAAPSVAAIVAVVPAEEVEAAKRLLAVLPKLRAVAAGGSSRQDSVLAGLKQAPPGFEGVVLVHDAARPFADVATIEAVAQAAAEHGAALPVLPLVDTVKRVREGRVVETLDRSELGAAQTPQGFRLPLLVRAYEDAFRDRRDGNRRGDGGRAPRGAGGGRTRARHATESSPPRKTWPGPRAFSPPRRPGPGREPPRGSWLRRPPARARAAPPPGRSGHPLRPRPRRPFRRRLRPPRGLRRPPGRRRRRRHGPALSEHRSEVEGRREPRVRRRAWRSSCASGATSVENVDVTVVAQAPALAPHLDKMREALGSLLGLSPDAVSVKAKSTDGLGALGRVEGIAAQAVVLVRRQS